MTHEETMDGLARRIAELRKDWAMVGMTMTDREMGVVWHRTLLPGSVVGCWQCEYGFDTKSQERESFERARPNGPEWRHAVTALGLLALLPDVEVKMRSNGWNVEESNGYDHDTQPTYGTREEAILRAVVAHLEAK